MAYDPLTTLVLAEVVQRYEDKIKRDIEAGRIIEIVSDVMVAWNGKKCNKRIADDLRAALGDSYSVYYKHDPKSTFEQYRLCWWQSRGATDDASRDKPDVPFPYGSRMEIQIAAVAHEFSATPGTDGRVSLAMFNSRVVGFRESARKVNDLREMLPLLPEWVKRYNASVEELKYVRGVLGYTAFPNR